MFGIYGHADAARLTYLGLYALQHRGQESCGIVVVERIRACVWNAPWVTSPTPSINRALIAWPAPARSVTFVIPLPAKFRFAKRNRSWLPASTDKSPFATTATCLSREEERRKLESEGAIFSATSDTEVILHGVARSKAASVREAIPEVLRDTEGAFSMLFLTPSELIAIRDPRGFRPLALGRLGDAWVVASETCAFDLIDAQYVRDVEPGEMIVIDRRWLAFLASAATSRSIRCACSSTSISRGLTRLIYGQSVNESRHKMGKRLAIEQPADADMVVPVPDSGTVAAIGYSAQSEISFRFGLVRNHYVGRTFIEPRQSIRSFGVRIKLNPVRHLIEGKRVVLIDDSIVRGTTSKKIVRMVREAGAKEIHLRISCPPTISPCYYGIDTPNKADLIAAQMSVEEI